MTSALPYPLTARDGLVALADSVRRYFAANNVDAEVPEIGIDSRANRWAEPRVVFVPGDYDGSSPPKTLDEGRFTPPEHTKSDNPRELVTWERVCTACVLGVDADHKTSMQAQIEASAVLVELTLQAMWNAFDQTAADGAFPTSFERGYAGQASLSFDSSRVRRLYPPTIMGFGTEVLFTFVQKGPFFDVPEPLIVPQPAIAGSLT